MPSKEKRDQLLAHHKLAKGPYPYEALTFVHAGFGHASKSALSAGGQLATDDRHLSGQQLCLGLMEFAIDQYGMMAPVVIKRWNVQRTDDFGQIVFALIELGALSKSPNDSIEDFRSVFDFAEVFSQDRLRKHILGSRNSTGGSESRTGHQMGSNG